MIKNRWDSKDIRDQKGKIVIVTGANSGIGFETAKVFADKNAKVIIAVRNSDKGNAAAEKIKDQNKAADVRVMELDLASLESIRKFADSYLKEYGRLDLLINNAGVMVPPYSKTSDGFELQFGTNHLGHFALTALLWKSIASTENSRIVSVSSGAHRYGNLNFDDLNWEKRKYKPWRAYGDSKISNLYFTYELGRRAAAKNLNVIIAAAHPGYTSTDLQRHSTSAKLLNPLLAQNPQMGALPTLYAATADEVKTGDYFGPSGFMEMKGYPKKTESNELSRSNEIAAKLWNVSQKLTGIEFNL